MNHYYSKHIHDEEDRVKTVNFLKLEQQCDAENAVEALAIRDTGELKKGQVVNINAAIKRWYREGESLMKKFTPSSRTFIGYSSLATKRTWINA